MIVSISGLIGSGKDTIADYLVDKHGFVRESWAGTLKDAVAAVFSWDRDLLEGKTAGSRQWREASDEWWTSRLGVDVTPRRVLQLWGTEVCRQGFHDDIWIASLENKLRNSNKNVVISDTRFPNELQSVKKLGGMTIRVRRGKLPRWINDFEKHGATQHFFDLWPTVHASEYSSLGLEYDYYIQNDGTFDELYNTVNDLVQCHQAAK